MSSRKEIVGSFYSQYDEDGRTIRSRHGQLEYCTTMTYIHRYTTPHSKILEVGAGTGRYSIALAKEGLAVTAVELVESNLASVLTFPCQMRNLALLPNGIWYFLRSGSCWESQIIFCISAVNRNKALE